MSRVLGTSVRRKEDLALLTGRGRYADDLPVPKGTLHAHVIRSPHPHAKIAKIDTARALAQPGVAAVVTGEEVRKLSDPFLIALKAPVLQWSLAVERVRYVGEPVALVVAEDRYKAEDAAELVVVDYEPLPVVIDALAACRSAINDRVGGEKLRAHAAVFRFSLDRILSYVARRAEIIFD